MGVLNLSSLKNAEQLAFELWPNESKNKKTHVAVIGYRFTATDLRDRIASKGYRLIHVYCDSKNVCSRPYERGVLTHMDVDQFDRFLLKGYFIETVDFKDPVTNEKVRYGILKEEYYEEGSGVVILPLEFMNNHLNFTYVTVELDPENIWKIGTQVYRVSEKDMLAFAMYDHQFKEFLAKPSKVFIKVVI